MRTDQETGAMSRKWVEALRAATLVLEAEVCKQIVARRADLPRGQRKRLEDASHRALLEALELYSPLVWERFEIDEPELRRKAVALAGLRIQGRLREADGAMREILRRALAAA